MKHFHHFQKSDGTLGDNGKNDKHKTFMKFLLIHIGILVLIVLHIIVIRLIF